MANRACREPNTERRSSEAWMISFLLTIGMLLLGTGDAKTTTTSSDGETSTSAILTSSTMTESTSDNSLVTWPLSDVSQTTFTDDVITISNPRSETSGMDTTGETVISTVFETEETKQTTTDLSSSVATKDASLTANEIITKLSSVTAVASPTSDGTSIQTLGESTILDDRTQSSDTVSNLGISMSGNAGNIVGTASTPNGTYDGRESSTVTEYASGTITIGSEITSITEISEKVDTSNIDTTTAGEQRLSTVINSEESSTFKLAMTTTYEGGSRVTVEESSTLNPNTAVTQINSSGTERNDDPKSDMSTQLMEPTESVPQSAVSHLVFILGSVGFLVVVVTAVVLTTLWRQGKFTRQSSYALPDKADAMKYSPSGLGWFDNSRLYGRYWQTGASLQPSVTSSQVPYVLNYYTSALTRSYPRADHYNTYIHQ